MKYKDPVTGEIKTISVKAGDSLPIGTIVEYDGTIVPKGYVEVEEDEKVVWTNSNPSAEWGDKNVSVNLSGYSHIELFWCLTNTDLSYEQSSGKIPVGKSARIVSELWISGLEESIAWRNISVGINGFYTSKGFAKSMENNNINYDIRTIIVPTKIIAYK